MLPKSFLLALAAVLGAFVFSTSAIAADGETKTLNNNSYHQYAFVLCNTADYCQVYFPPTTAATTVIKAVSCLVNATSGSFAGMSLGTTASQETFYLQAFILESYGYGLTVTVNGSTNLFYSKGDRPFVTAYVSNGGSFLNSLTCTITGEQS